MLQKPERVRIEYRLPADTHNQFQSWQCDERGDQYPNDPMQVQRNRAEFAAKAAAGLIKRRAH